MDCTVLGISMERSKELYNIMFKDLEAQKRPITDTEGLNIFIPLLGHLKRS